MMSDPRVAKMAQVLVGYSLQLKPGQQFVLRTTPLAEELNTAVLEEAIKAGAHVVTMGADQPMTLQGIPGADEIFYKFASDAQLDFISPIRKLITESFDASL